MSKKVLIVSAVNLIEGGTLTILNKCLSFLDIAPSIYENYRIIALVHKKSMFHYEHIEFLEYPKAKTSWLLRIYYEYWIFNKLSKRLKPYLWLSLHDMSPRVRAVHQAVYCHNSTPFYQAKIKDLHYSYKVFLFSYLYKYLYRINIKANDYVIVQQDWLREAFERLYKLDANKIIVAYPNEQGKHQEVVASEPIPNDRHTVFFFPSLSRPFKNFEIICKATNLLQEREISDFEVVLTIDGSEDSYSKGIVDKYRNNTHLSFCGKLSYDDVFKMYGHANCLIFPSKLETWGLPISEFIDFCKPMIIADLPYAHETASGASCVSFFSPDDAKQLADIMENVIDGNLRNFVPVKPLKINEPFVQSWQALFDVLLC